MRYAAIDIGTNTVRLLVADVESDELTNRTRAMEITRLGEGVDSGRVLGSEPVARTAQAVESFVERARSQGAGVIRVCGTSALRDARNADELAEMVHRRCGVEVEILDGENEGRIAFLGASSGLDAGPLLVCDIGGGSTEFIRGTSWVESVWSADIGSVRLRERILTSDPPTPGEIEGARTLIELELVEVERDVGLVGNETLVGVAGTVTTLAGLVLGLREYDSSRIHGFRLRAADVSSWTARLLEMPAAAIRSLPGMPPLRADVISAGSMILREVMTRWRFSEVLVSEQDILDGLVLDLVLGPDAGLPAAPEL